MPAVVALSGSLEAAPASNVDAIGGCRQVPAWALASSINRFLLLAWLVPRRPLRPVRVMGVTKQSAGPVLRVHWIVPVRSSVLPVPVVSLPRQRSSPRSAPGEGARLSLPRSAPIQLPSPEASPLPLPDARDGGEPGYALPLLRSNTDALTRHAGRLAGAPTRFERAWRNDQGMGRDSALKRLIQRAIVHPSSIAG